MLGGIAGVAIVWILLTVLRAIIGEYAKRIWFEHIHPGESEKARAAIAKTRKALDQEQLEFQSLKANAEALLTRIDTLTALCIKHGIDTSK